MTIARRARVIAAWAFALSLAACAGGAPGSTAPVSPTASPVVDAFGDLPYRMDLPTDWIALGTPAYDTTLDTAPDVAAWMEALDLVGQNEFRAYEPLQGAIGLRLAIRPMERWNPSPLQDEGTIVGLAGVRGEPSSDVLATGADWKAFGYRWTQSIDWGNGTPSERACVGYFVMVDNPVNVVFSWPAGSDRYAEVAALVSTFEVLRNPVWSQPPGVTPSPSPTPYDKYGSPEPVATFHAAPDMEALLPDTIDGRPVTKESRTGIEGLTADDPLLKAFDKQPADLRTASGTVRPTADQPAMLLSVERLVGVPGEQVLAFQLTQMRDATISHVTLGGHEVTYVEYGAWPMWMYASGDVVYMVGLAGEDAAAAFFATLP